MTSPSSALSAAELWSELLNTASPEERLSLVAQKPDLLQPRVVADLVDLVPKLLRYDRDKANDAADCALMLAEKLRDPGCKAMSLRAKANVLFSQGENRAAVEHHKKALKLFRQTENLTQVARTLSTSIQPLILLGRYDQAVAAAEEARRIFSRQGDEWRLARVELNTGNIFDRLDRFREALACYEKAYRYFVSHKDIDTDALAVALHNMAGCLVYLNDFRRASSVYHEAREFALRNNLPMLVGQCDYNIAWLHYLRGEYSQAISLLCVARDSCQQNDDRYHSALCQLDLSEIYLELKLTVEAIEASQAALGQFSDLEMTYEWTRALTNLAIGHTQQGRNDVALELFARARRAFVKEKNTSWPFIIDLYRASVLYDESKYLEANELCTSALTAFRQNRLPSKQVLSHILLARSYLRTNQLYQASVESIRALKILRHAELPALRFQAYSVKAETHLAAGHKDRAYGALLKARSCLEQLRNSIKGEELKISFMKDRVEIYEGLVQLCLEREPAGAGHREAFEYIEEAKSQNLLEGLATPQSASQIHPGTDTGVSMQVKELREELNFYLRRVEIERLQNGKHSTEYIEQLQSECLEKERHLLRLLREHAQQHRDTRQARPHTALEQIQGELSPGVTFLEYFEVHGEILVAVISLTEFRIVPLIAVSHITEIHTLFRFQISKLHLSSEYVNPMAPALFLAVRKHLAGLYNALVKKLRPHLKTSHLIIAPHGPLHGLPFHALLDQERYLMDDFTISYAPSASVYSVCASRQSPVASGALVMGIPDSSVPFVREEVEIVARQLPEAKLFVGENATTQILRERGRESRFIHIATHGYFRQDNPMFSSIRLGDGYLTLLDLYQLQLRAELVTLSGCSTGVGALSGGNELLGLARELIYAGARCSLLTLWDVQDESSSHFMQQFYRSLIQGKDKAAAMRAAVSEIREKYEHPYYWAPFVLVGNM